VTNTNKQPLSKPLGVYHLLRRDPELQTGKVKTPWLPSLSLRLCGKILFLTLLLLASIAIPAAAQEAQGLVLRMNRDFGFSSGSKVQGTFTLKATNAPNGPADIQRVVFYIDQQVLGEDTQAPFELRFNTDAHPLGEHNLHAVGFTASGAEVRSNEIRVSFVSAEEGWQAGLEIAGPMLGIVFVMIVLSTLLSIVGGKKLKRLPPGTPRSYGAAGGAICKRCGRPFPRHFLAPNMLVGKLERCPYCGQWAIVAAHPLEALRAAEAAEIADAQAGVLEDVEDEAGRLRRQIDESRYQG